MIGPAMYDPSNSMVNLKPVSELACVALATGCILATLNSSYITEIAWKAAWGCTGGV
jgi:hypothetical protein